MNVDVIFAPSSTEVEAARHATKPTPIVFAAHADPVGIGHVASLPRPGGNITGLTMLMTDLAAKELEILKEAVPQATRIGVLWNPTTPSHLPALRALKGAGEKLGVALQMVPARTAEDFDGALASMVAERVGAFIVLGSPLMLSYRAHLAELAVKYRLPSMFSMPEPVETGGLMSYTADLNDLTRRAADERDEVAAFHSITSSARASSVGGRSSASAFAVLRFTTKSNSVGCSTGRSAGLPPLRILSRKEATRRNESTKLGP
jgi:putative tryptophan/tyrosine transport system substrate-binding protein